MNISIIARSCGVCGKDWEVNETPKTYNRIYYIESGEAYCTIDSKVQKLQKNSLYIFPSNSCYKIAHNPDNPLNHLWFHVESSPVINKLVCFENIKDELSLMIIKTLEKMLSDHVDCEIENRLLEILLEILFEKYKIDITIQESLQRVLEYIHKNYNKKLVLDDLCEAGEISKSYLIKKFRETTSTTPYKYVENYRINKAISYLEDDIKTEKIAKLAGFEDVKLFYRAFKKITGYSIGQYKCVATNIAERNRIKRIFATNKKINEV